MEEISTHNKLHYIIDLAGNYYRVNANNQLVAAKSRDEAGVFSYIEANERLGNGRKSNFYSLLSVDECADFDESAEIKDGNNCGLPQGKYLKTDAGRQDMESIGENLNVRQERHCDYNELNYNIRQTPETMQLPYNLKEIDWKEYLVHFAYVASCIRDYHDELDRQLSDVNLGICDIMHYIELYDLNEEEMIKITSMLKKCREYRRDVKDEIFRVECFQKSLGNSANVAKVKDAVKQMETLDNRHYNPRKFVDLFENCPPETVRPNRLVEEEAVSELECCGETLNNDMEGTNMDGFVKRETIFDGKQNDWEQFARQQAQIYSDIPQYMLNLKIDIGEIDNKISNILEQVEEANYNVIQGYNIYKNLRDLRNERKEKEAELRALDILTCDLDFISAAEEYKCRINDIMNMAV